MRILAPKRDSAIIYIILIASIFLIIYLSQPFYIVFQTTKIFSSMEIVSNQALTLHVTNISCMPCPILSLPPTTRISHEWCSLSLNESDGWFCEYDDDWERRKRIHQIQDERNRNIETSSQFFIKNWEPTLHCAFEQRIGSVGVGGKWICDVHKLETNNDVPLIYSIGSDGEFSFENAIKQVLPIVEIHTFDTGNYSCQPGVCTFHRTYLDDGKNGTKSLKTIIEEVGHTKRPIDILKIDIDGNEYLIFEEFFRHSQNTSNNTDSKQDGFQIPYIRQILIEIHLPVELGDEIARRANGLFELFRSNNYAIFHKEANLHVPNKATEYAFIRLNQAFFIPSS